MDCWSLAQSGVEEPTGFVVLTVASFKDEVVVDSPSNYPKSL